MEFKKVKKLKLDQCEVTNIPDSIKNLTNLEYLNLSCKIKTLNIAISKLKNLKILNLKRSYLLKKITKLPESLNHLIISNESLQIDEKKFFVYQI